MPALSLHGPKFRFGFFAALLTLLVLNAVAPSAMKAQGMTLYTVSPADAFLRTVDPVTGITVTSLAITLAGKTVLGANGLDRHPVSGQLFAIVRISGQGGRELVTIDPTTGVATDVGNTGDNFAGITFRNNGGTVTLYGVTGDGASTPETLFTLNLTTGAPTLVLALGNGIDGEVIAFNAVDGKIYHASGNGDETFEKVDPVTLAITNVPLSEPVAADIYNEATALTHWAGNMFLLGDLSNNLFVITTGGNVRFLSALDHTAKGLVFVGAPPACPPVAGALFGEAHQGPDGPGLLYKLDPATAAQTLIGPIGFEFVGSLAFNGTGTLFGIGERQDGTNTNVLLTIDPCTGLGTEVGPTGIKGLGFGNATDISFRHSDGTLFAHLLGVTGRELATIDTVSGQAAPIGLISGVPDSGNGIAFSAADTLFHANSVDLNTIDPATAVSTQVAPLTFSPPADNFPRMNAMDFQLTSGGLFGSVNDGTGGAVENYLGTIDTTTGVVTLVSTTQTQGGLDAIAFVPPPQDFAISNTSGTVTVTAGATGQFTIHVVPGVSGFPNSITFTATPAPTATTLSFTPASVTPGITPTDVVLKLVTTAPSVVPPRGIPMRGPWGPVAPLVAACVLMLLWLVTKRQRLQYQRLAACLPLIALLICAATFAGCSGLPPPLSGGTPAKTYMVDVTGTAGAVTHTITVQLVVQ